MSNDDLQEIWAKGQEEKKMSTAELQAILQPKFRKTALGQSIVAWTYLAFLAATLVSEGMYVYAFRTNASMLAVGAVLIVSTLGFLAYGIHLQREMAVIDRTDESLVSRIRRRLRFHRTRSEIWLWMIALSLVFLTFTVSTAADADEGTYRINHPFVFGAVTLGQLVFAYGVLKMGQYPFVRESMAILSDLEHQVTAGTERVEALRKSWRLWGVLLFTLCTILLILGILRAIGRIG